MQGERIQGTDIRMKRFVLVVFAIALVVTDALAAKAVKGQFTEAPPPPDGYAVVYMYRLKTEPAMRKAQIHVDGERVALLSNKSYTWFYVSAGSHILRTKWGFMADIPELEGVLQAQPGGVHYVKMTGSVQMLHAGGSRTYSGIHEVSESEGRADLTKTKKYNPAIVQTIGQTTTATLSEKQQAHAETLQYASPPQAGYALVYFYRPKSPPALKSPKVLVDDREYFRMANQGYTWLYLPVGTHTIRTNWGGLANHLNQHLTITAANGATHYVRFSVTRDNNSASLNQVDEHLAKKEFPTLRRYVETVTTTVQ